jgi:hypothetical protein
MTLTFAQHLTETVGSIFEIAGTFLLAVEAIKLENLQMVRLNWVRDRFLWAISPRVWITSKDTHEQVKSKGQKAFNRIAVIVFLVGSIAAYGMLGSMGHSMMDVYHGIAAGISGPTWFSNVAAAFAAPTLIFGIAYFAVGLLYCAALGFLWGMYRTLFWIEKHTVKGTVGILGFFVFLAGALLHIYISWSAG